jgi:hypothetical protein
MKKVFLILLVSSIFLSCEEKKIEFIQSKTMPHIFLLKNVPNEDILLKNQISDFLVKYPIKNVDKLPQINFYRYTFNSSYFINHIPDPGGFSSYDFKDKERLAVFSISKCKRDSTKLVGQLYFYKDNFFQADTLIYKCK